MARRSGMLEFAVLGLLHDTPMHGYELRKRLNVLLGSLRAFSYGTLYPCLKTLLANGWLAEEPASTPPPSALAGKRSKIVYRLTDEGRARFQELLDESGPDSWEDDDFGVRLAFFSRTDGAVRMRILEGRRNRLDERLDRLRKSLARSRERLDDYSFELQRHRLESIEREVNWLGQLIERERGNTARPPRPEGGAGAGAGDEHPGAPGAPGPAGTVDAHGPHDAGPTHFSTGTAPTTGAAPNESRRSLGAGPRATPRRRAATRRTMSDGPTDPSTATS
ncbi:DNA-binding PadR family transcriptional regulator [Allostreptomyces psammosilenae]|uniref:DNA-binding PadR family transcriptional regulator n=1 Tax=Allostreptomyces psammosilenae TaxID=1892865 RepID=A0A852ZUZ7_9ACTN|nr:DNA-binding PadR family transcriptional regulator [Allostreptomyces psammosilenae]